MWDATIAQSALFATDRLVLPSQVEAVVRRVIWLTQRDAHAKLLIFSTWAEVLLLLEHALRTNEVPHARAKDRKALDAAIAAFREESAAPGKQPVRTLLLLLKQGANGLNLTGARAPSALSPAPHLRRAWALRFAPCMRRPPGLHPGEGMGCPCMLFIGFHTPSHGGFQATARKGTELQRCARAEAQHVLLVEPLLDPGVEAQAIGRVHRIGQVCGAVCLFRPRRFC